METDSEGNPIAPKQNEMDQSGFLNQLPTAQNEDIWYTSDLHKVLDKIVEDKQVDERLKDFPLWSGGTKSMKLTFFNDRDIAVLENLFESEVCRYLRSLPPSKHTAETYTNLGQARMIFFSNIRRSLGTPIQKINERIAILSQWKIQTTPDVAPQPRRGIWNKLFG